MVWRYVGVFEDTLEHFWVQNFGGMYGNGCPLSRWIFINLMAAVLPRQSKSALLQYRDYFTGSDARQLGHT